MQTNRLKRKTPRSSDRRAVEVHLGSVPCDQARRFPRPGRARASRAESRGIRCMVVLLCNRQHAGLSIVRREIPSSTGAKPSILARNSREPAMMESVRPYLPGEIAAPFSSTLGSFFAHILLTERPVGTDPKSACRRGGRRRILTNSLVCPCPPGSYGANKIDASHARIALSTEEML